MEDLLICGSHVMFKVDTGADITVINKTYSALKEKPPLQTNRAVLHSSGGKLTVKGSSLATFIGKVCTTSAGLL